MRKQLMAGTALVAATMLVAGGASAQDKKMMKPSLTVNAAHQQVISGIADRSQKAKWSHTDGTSGEISTEVDTSAIDVRGNTEVHFNGSATLDNGMKITARVALEGQSHTSDGKPSPANGNDQIDESWVAVSGSFGKIILGSDENAAVQMLIGMTGAWATNVGQNLHFNSGEWIPAADGTGGGRFHVMHDARIREHGGGGDGEKITYISPRFGGFQVGLSYIPEEEQDDNRLVDISGVHHDGLAGAASYQGKFGDVGFAVGGGMISMQGREDTTGAAGEDKSSWGLAGRLDFGGGFRVAVGYEQWTSPRVLEGSVVEAGVRFVSGANQFSLSGTHGEKENDAAQYTAVGAGYNRVLGPGVSWHANLMVTRSESAVGTADCSVADSAVGAAACAALGKNSGTLTGQQENSGAVITSGITVRF